MTTVSKKLMTLAIGAIVSTTAVLSISQANAFERGEHRGERGQRGGASFTRIDVNQDGVLSLDEILTPKLSKSEAKFIRKDIDEDGLLSLEEFQQSFRGNSDLSDIAAELVQCISDVKAETANDLIVVPNVDKFISSEAKFNLIDSSADGFLSLGEVVAVTTEKVTNTFTLVDTDIDGVISEEEFNNSKATRSATGSAIRQCTDEVTADDLV